MTVTLHIKIEDTEGQDAGSKYLAWLKANNIPQTSENLKAFVAGFAIALAQQQDNCK